MKKKGVKICYVSRQLVYCPLISCQLPLTPSQPSFGVQISASLGVSPINQKQSLPVPMHTRLPGNHTELQAKPSTSSTTLVAHPGCHSILQGNVDSVPHSSTDSDDDPNAPFEITRGPKGKCLATQGGFAAALCRL